MDTVNSAKDHLRNFDCQKGVDEIFRTGFGTKDRGVHGSIVIDTILKSPDRTDRLRCPTSNTNHVGCRTLGTFVRRRRVAVSYNL